MQLLVCSYYLTGSIICQLQYTFSPPTGANLEISFLEEMVKGAWDLNPEPGVGGSGGYRTVKTLIILKNYSLMPRSNNRIAVLVEVGVELHLKALGHCRHGIYSSFCNTAKLGSQINFMCAGKLAL
jgi:hypothetical protein